MILLIRYIIETENNAPRKEKKDRENLNNTSKPKKIESVTKKFAPDDIPNKKGSARGFKKRVWDKRPAIERDAPTIMDDITLGNLIFKKSSSLLFKFIKKIKISFILYLFAPKESDIKVVIKIRIDIVATNNLFFII